MLASLTLKVRYWPEYLIEAAGIGSLVMVMATFSLLLNHPNSPLIGVVPDPWVRRSLGGVGSGVTAMTLTYSRWGMRSGAHFNPALTLTFYRLGKVRGVDALCYVGCQCLGALLGMGIAVSVVGAWLAHPKVNFLLPKPGVYGSGVAFFAEVILCFGLMLTVLAVSNHPQLARWTGVCAGSLVALYISFEAPISGPGLNPARCLAAALAAQDWHHLWIYVTAPLIGMLLAAECFVRLKGANSVNCAKLNHPGPDQPCLFNCSYRARHQAHLLLSKGSWPES